MMLDFQSLTPGEPLPSEEEEEEIPEPSVTVVYSDDRYGKFTTEPIQQGYGITLGTPCAGFCTAPSQAPRLPGSRSRTCCTSTRPSPTSRRRYPSSY